jgi:C1A family cysteine protease
MQHRVFTAAVPAPDDTRDHVVEAIRSVPARALPRALDLRHMLPEVRDQGESSTCAAQTGACIKEYHERREVDFRNHFSPQFIYSRRANAPEPGMHGRDVMHILRTFGVPPEDLYPFGTSEDPTASVTLAAGNAVIKEYARVDTIAGLKLALAVDGPCYIAFPVYNQTRRMWAARPGDVRTGGHAMTVVGYTAGGFILRNSWGTKWGDGGHCEYPYADFGAHWDIWTAVDADGTLPIEGTPARRQCCAIT